MINIKVGNNSVFIDNKEYHSFNDPMALFNMLRDTFDKMSSGLEDIELQVHIVGREITHVWKKRL